MTCESFSLESGTGTAALDLLNVILGFASCLACLGVFWGYLRNSNKSLHDTSSMIVMLAASDMFLAISSILEGVYPAHEACASEFNLSVCVVKACVSQFFGLSSFLWSAAMAHSSYGRISRLFTITQYSSQGAQVSAHHGMLFYHILCWGIPLLSLVVVMATRSAGPSSSHLCWVTVDRSGNNDSELPVFAGLLLFVLPLVLVECYLISTFRWLAKILLQMPSESSQLLSRVYTLLAVIVGLKLVFLSTRTVRMLYPDNTTFFLGFLVIIGAPLQGLGDFYIFRVNPVSAENADKGDASAINTSSTTLSRRGQSIEMHGRKGYSTVRNPLSSVEDGDLDDAHLKNIGHSAVGLIGSTDADEMEENEFEGDHYATLTGDSAHSLNAASSSDEFDEIIFDDSPTKIIIPVQNKRMSSIGLLDADDTRKTSDKKW